MPTQRGQHCAPGRGGASCFTVPEMRRIATYTAKGDLAPVADVLRYLDARGGGGGGGGDGGEAGRSEGELDERREEGDDEL